MLKERNEGKEYVELVEQVEFQPNYLSHLALAHVHCTLYTAHQFLLPKWELFFILVGCNSPVCDEKYKLVELKVINRCIDVGMAFYFTSITNRKSADRIHLLLYTFVTRKNKIKIATGISRNNAASRVTRYYLSRPRVWSVGK